MSTTLVARVLLRRTSQVDGWDGAKNFIRQPSLLRIVFLDNFTITFFPAQRKTFSLARVTQIFHLQVPTGKEVEQKLNEKKSRYPVL